MASAELTGYQAVDQLRKDHGIEKLDIVLANAGVFPDQGMFVDLTAQDAEHVWRVNVSLECQLSCA